MPFIGTCVLPVSASSLISKLSSSPFFLQIKWKRKVAPSPRPRFLCSLLLLSSSSLVVSPKILIDESVQFLTRYLVPADLTVGQLVSVVRQRIKISSEEAILVFVKNVLPPTGAMMGAIYEGHKDEDDFLYVTCSAENTFGHFYNWQMGVHKTFIAT